MKEYLECGKIANTHGVFGKMIIESWCDTPQVLASLKTVYFENSGKYEPVDVVKADEYKGRVLAEFRGVDTFELAAALKDRTVFARRGDLPCKEGSHFIQDLIGLPVFELDTNEKYGVLTDVVSSGASDLYEVQTKNGKFLIPAVKEFVKKIDTDSGIYIQAIEGMFE